ncbi:hypothetical protein E8E14_014539 [Neopestalotiopsis sp. 37M]|nr:hypothetical protein E8E14_014539 [Neopestalotiopsis sp. 37M]
MSQTAILKLPVSRCRSCNETDYCAGCRESNIGKLRRRWVSYERSDDFDKDVFQRLFVLRYGREAVGTAMWHKYFTAFSHSMKWQKESLARYIDAICQGKLEEMPLSSTYIPNDALSQLSTDDLLGRCSELTRHLQKLHAELAARQYAEVLADSDAESVYSDVEFEECFLSPGQVTPSPATQPPTPPTSRISSTIPEDQQLRSTILMHWGEDENSQGSKFVRLPLHTPRFLVVLLELARYYTWSQTANMVNYIVIERVRHFRNSEDKNRYPRLDDWQRVLSMCRTLGFPRLDPEKLSENDLLALNFRITDKGLVKEGNSFHPEADKLEAATPSSGNVIVTAGPALQIRFREEDLSILETHPLTPGLVLAGATTDSTAVTAAQTSSVSTSIASFSTITVRPSAVSREETSALDTTEDGTSSNSVISSAGSPGGSVSLVTTTQATTTTAQASDSESNGSLNPGSVAAITLSSILIVIVLVISSVIFMRRSRRKRHDKAARLQPYRYKPWLGGGGFSDSRRISTSSVDSIVLPLQSAAELPGTAPVIPELALSTRLGAKENPAELGAEELAAELSGNARGPSTTWSWMSKASRRGSARSQKTRSSIAPSSFTRWTRSAASMQTASSGRYSGDWESFARGKWPNGLTVPAVPMERPLPDVPKTPRSAKLHVASYYLKPDSGRDRWSRESAGTFGAPGKSPVSTIFTNKP